MASADPNTTGSDEWSESRVSRVIDDANYHNVHTYFNTCPESPDGRYVLLYASREDDGHCGDIRIVERSSGTVRVLAENVTVEDIHRAACQQWIANGEMVVFHDLRNGDWVVVSIDITSGKEVVLATGRQLGFGQPTGDRVPLYGPHWKPGEFRNLEMLDVRTGEIKTVLEASRVADEYRGYVEDEFGEQPLSIFFPIVSPDSKSVFFKLSTPDDGLFRSPTGSARKGFICYSLETNELIMKRESWGHPAWHPDSTRIVNVDATGLVLIDLASRSVQTIPDLPKFPGSHPSVSPDGNFIVTDTRFAPFGGTDTEWAIVVLPTAGSHSHVLHHFENSNGATSWRRSHPHPVFSGDGERIYFNVNSGKWSELYVATREQI